MEKTCIQYIKEVAKKVINSELKRLGAAPTKAAIEGVMRTVGLATQEEAVLFCAYFDKSCQGRSMDFDDVSRYFGCPALDVMEMVPSIKTLLNKGYLMRTRSAGNIGDDSLADIMHLNLMVADSVLSAIIAGTPICPKPLERLSASELDRYEFCAAVGKLVEDDDVDTMQLCTQVDRLETANQHLGFVITLQATVADVADRALFYDLAFDHYRSEGNKKSDIVNTLRDIHTNFSHYILAKKEILDGTHTLIKDGLIEKFDEKEMRLTPKGCALFYGEDLKYFVKDRKCEDIYAFMAMVSDFMHDHDQFRPSKDYAELPTLLTTMENENRHIRQLQEVARVMHSAADRAMLYVLGADVADGRSTTMLSMAQIFRADKLMKAAIDQFRLKKSLIQTRGYAELEKKDGLMGNQMMMKLTEKGLHVLLGEEAEMFVEEIDDKNLISPDTIAGKELFFSPKLDEQLSLVRSSLQPDTFATLRSRLEQQNMPKGVAILLYGEPGTGKTESVMQMARATGRAVMHVDISNTKSMWFGESEKIIKQVFADYRRLCERSQVKPILLFNEADAIFSKRKDVGRSSVAQTENAIQNIILEEMEHLDGILVATTNLANNLDAAFERRFLFKIRFDRPTIEAKKSIWQSKLAVLTDADAESLATQYDFSGGQIDNIVRKAIMNEIVKGERPTLATLQTLCAEERISRGTASKIGFC